MDYAVGVDLGTTYTAAAVVRRGHAELVTLGDTAADVPSVLFVTPDGREIVGDAAVRRGSQDPGRVAREFKRRLGDHTPLLLGGRPVSAQALTGHLLRWVVDEVAKLQGGPPSRVVVTVPATWGPFRREVMDSAIAIADVDAVETCPEPVAAALHFAASERIDPGGIVAVYDLGGGTFDATVLRNAGQDFEVLGTPGGLDHLGGVDFDEAVFAHVLAAADEATAAFDPDDADVTLALMRLRQECTVAKEHLSADTEATVPVVLPGAVRRDVRLTRPEFEDLIRPSVAETIACLRRVLDSASVDPGDLAAVVLVGGSAKVPLVTEMLGHELGRPVALSPAPKHAVALGAAMVAGRSLAPAPRAATPVPPVRGDEREHESTPAPSRHEPPAPRLPPVPRAPEPRREGGARERPSRADRGLVPSPPRLRLVVAGLGVLAVLLSVAAPWALPPAGSAGDVSLGGSRLDGAVLRLDLDEPQSLVVVEPRSDEAVITLSVSGWAFSSLRVPLTDGRGEVDLSAAAPGGAGGGLGSLGNLAAGPVRATVTGAASAEVLLWPDAFYATVSFGLWVVLLLFVVAYAESVLRGVRRRRRARAVDVAGMAALGVLAGLVLAGAGWVTSGLLAVRAAPVLVVATVLCLAAAGAALAPLTAQRAARRGAGNRQRP